MVVRLFFVPSASMCKLPLPFTFALREIRDHLSCGITKSLAFCVAIALFESFSNPLILLSSFLIPKPGLLSPVLSV